MAILIDNVVNRQGHEDLNHFLVDTVYLSAMQTSNSIYAKQIIEVHKQPEIVDRIKLKHLKLWDDFVPLYLIAPSLFVAQDNMSQLMNRWLELMFMNGCQGC